MLCHPGPAVWGAQGHPKWCPPWGVLFLPTQSLCSPPPPFTPCGHMSLKGENGAVEGVAFTPPLLTAQGLCVGLLGCCGARAHDLMNRCGVHRCGGDCSGTSWQAWGWMMWIPAHPPHMAP